MLIFTITLLFAAFGAIAIFFGTRAYRARRRFPTNAEALLAGFLTQSPPSEQAYADLFEYFAIGFKTYRSRLGAHARYPGMGSYNGPKMDRLEGYSRVAPLLAAWLHGTRPRLIELHDGSQLDVLQLLRSGILEGTNPNSKDYWGTIKHWQQAIVEAADIALSLWLSRSILWEELTDKERTQIASWLIQVNSKGIPDNNWHLFVVQVNAVLAALGQPYDAVELERHYLRSKKFYRGNGWFRDGENKETPGFDFYNAWGFHYHLQWIRRIDPALDADFIDSALAAFVSKYRYLIGPAGLPMLGRSACYRMAAPVPLIFAQDSHRELVNPGEARRALDVVWQHFIRRGAVAHGNVTQGYYGADPRLLENYSGPASCLWALRSLIAAFALPADHAFWRSTPQPLPVETGDYQVAIDPPLWTVAGNSQDGTITVTTESGDTPPLEEYSVWNRLVGAFASKPRRPKNTAAKYLRARYCSTNPYGIGNRP